MPRGSVEQLTNLAGRLFANFAALLAANRSSAATTHMRDDRMRLSTPIVALLATAVFALGACGDDDNGGGERAARGFPMTVENCGRKLTFQTQPERIMAVGAEAPSVLAAADADDRIAVVATLEGALYGKATAAVTRATQLGEARELSRESVIAARPDLIVSDGSLSEAIPPKDLAAAGIPTLFVSGYCGDEGFPLKGTPSAFELIYGDIRLYGRLFGTDQAARDSVADLRGRVAAIKRRVASIRGGRTAALYLYADSPLGAYGNKTVVHEQMAILGQKNVFGDVAKRYFEPSAEQIIKRNPATMIGLFIPGQSMLPNAQRAVQEVRSRRELAKVKAVRDNAILPLNYYYAGPGPLAVDGLEQLADQLVAKR
jgi:iron complex transport system substrate-binding protein